jgi:DNA-binding transcriptional ArsR family regulator
MSSVLAALGALAQENRLAVFRLLVEHAPQGLPAGTIAERLSLAPATLSFHLKELVHAGLVASRPDGRFVWYRANLETMNRVVDYLTENCCRAGDLCATVRVPAKPARAATPPLPARARRKTS